MARLSHPAAVRERVPLPRNKPPGPCHLSDGLAPYTNLVQHPRERIYTFWKYFRNAFARDAGLRIDHLLLNPPLAARLSAAGVDREARGREHASDHAPAWIELAGQTLALPGQSSRVKKTGLK